MVVSDVQRALLETLSKSQTASHREVQRAQVLLMAAEGLASEWIARVVGVSPATVRSWRARFSEEGLAHLGDVRPGRGRKPVIPQSIVDQIVELTRNSKPEGHTHWSVRTMAAKVGVSPAQVQRIWAARGLKPHLVGSFKLSNDPQFEEKLIDVVGLYLNPPEKAIVLCMDEKSSIQALDRTQPSLPMTKGRAETMTHDY
ncbi:IS630 family transposase, partial [Paenarthrobacter sp. PH39-S1]|uniref:IS630 family transposase n=1 Tax=Paenarthrobacter sp. PH39-S1 TaxID=3046204 RepID=UPI0024BA4757